MLTPWLTDERASWLDEVHAWVEAQGHGAIRDVAVVHERVWGAVLRFTTPEGVLHFKALGVGCTHETEVIGYLGANWPTLAPTIHAIDHERNWLLVGDDGVAMYMLDPTDQISAMQQVLGAYGQMQIASVSDVDELVAAGIPDRRMNMVPGIVAGILDASLTFGRAIPISPEERRTMERLLPALEDVCRELSQRPATLEHGDLHNKNILVRDQQAKIIDWGDGCVTHPFCSLFPIYLVSMPRFADIDRSAAARDITRVYLESFGGASWDETLQVTWVAHATRAFHSVHMLDGMPEPQLTEWLGEIAALMKLWAERYDAMRDGTIIDTVVNAPSSDLTAGGP